MKKEIIISYTRGDFIYSSDLVNLGPLDTQYTTYSIPKGRGKRRIIHAPFPYLKKIQRTFLDRFLYNYYSDLISPASYGFIKGHNTANAAKQHIGKPIIVQVDLKNFFHSIHFSLIERTLRNNVRDWQVEYIPTPKLFSLTTTIIRNLCMGTIPSIGINEPVLLQGPPTSPFLANLAMYDIDEQITELADKYHLSYTRYADDMTFSGNVSAGTIKKKFLSDLHSLLKKDRLQINRSKIQVRRQHQRQKVLGITVNEKVSVPREIRRTLRARLHEYATRRVALPKDILGLLSYIKSVNPDQYEKLVGDFAKNRRKEAEI